MAGLSPPPTVRANTAGGPARGRTRAVFRQSWVTPRRHAVGSQQFHLRSAERRPPRGLTAVRAKMRPTVSLFGAACAGDERMGGTPDGRQPRQRRAARTAGQKVGNAVIFPDRSGLLWMVYVSVSVGGWSGSALNVKTSRDEGRTWGGSRRLTLNPFLNLSSLVRNKPIHASDGRIGLPVYHELAMKFPQMLWLTPGPDGSVEEFRIRNLSTEAGLIQPTLVPVDGDRVLMVLRDHGRGGRRVHTAYSDDNGWTWSGAEPSGLPNPDSAIDALRLRQRAAGLQPWVAGARHSAAGDFE